VDGEDGKIFSPIIKLGWVDEKALPGGAYTLPSLPVVARRKRM
jgi:hypothetical protein